LLIEGDIFPFNVGGERHMAIGLKKVLINWVIKLDNPPLTTLSHYRSPNRTIKSEALSHLMALLFRDHRDPLPRLFKGIKEEKFKTTSPLTLAVEAGFTHPRVVENKEAPFGEVVSNI
jgi:hypothetical protein